MMTREPTGPPVDGGAPAGELKRTIHVDLPETTRTEVDMIARYLGVPRNAAVNVILRAGINALNGRPVIALENI